MIIEIALGIVLAALILAFLPLILSVGLVLLVVAAIVLFVIVFWYKLAPVAGGIGVFVLLIGLPMYLKATLSRRYPGLDGLLAFESAKAMIRHPGRSALGALLALGIVLSGVVSLVASVLILEQLGVLK